MPSKRMLAGSITLSSSLPTCAVSPAETLRSLTMPSKGARTSVRCICWRACTTRALAASRSLCVVLRRISASSMACADAMPEPRRVFMRSSWRCACSYAWSAARLVDSAEASMSRMAVSSRRTRRSPRCTLSPFSLSACRTTVWISARRSARRSGCTDPVIVGPEASAVLWTVWMSSVDSSSGGPAGVALFVGVADPWLQAARASAGTMARMERRVMVVFGILVESVHSRPARDGGPAGWDEMQISGGEL